jgi:hypothetical protein
MGTDSLCALSRGPHVAQPMQAEDTSRAPFLVLAHHRSGSNFLNDLLQAHPRIECINEPLSMHTRYFRDCDLSPWSADDFDPDLLHASFDRHSGLREFLMEFKHYLLQSRKTRVLGFKETALFGKLAWFKSFIPSLKIIFLKRDPRAIVSSVLRSDLIDLWMYKDLVPAKFMTLYPDYVSRVHNNDSSVKTAEIIAMSIVVRYALAQQTIGLFDHITLSLEDFKQAPLECLTSVVNLLGIEPHDEQLSFLQQRQVVSRGGPFSSFRSSGDVEKTWTRHLSPAQIQAIENVLQVQVTGAHA